MNKQGSARKIGFIISAMIALSFLGQTASIPAAHAQGQITTQYTLLSPLPCLGNSCPGNDKSGTTANFQTYVSYAYNLFIALAAVAAVFMIVYGGFEYVTSTIPGNKNDGKKRIESALWGLLLVLASWLILRTINPHFVEISNTLVPQLNLTETNPNLAKNSNADYFQSLQDSIDKYNQQLQAQAKQVNADFHANSQNLTDTKAAVASLEQQKATLEDKLIQAEQSGDLSQTDIQNQIDDLDAQINKQKADTAYEEGQNVLLAVIHNTLTGTASNNPANLKNFGDTADQAYNEAETQLQQLGAYDQAKQLTDLYKKVGGDLIIQQSVGVNIQNSQSSPNQAYLNNTIAQTSAVVQQNYLNQITDPAIKAQLQADLDAGIQNMKDQYNLINKKK